MRARLMVALAAVTLPVSSAFAMCGGGMMQNASHPQSRAPMQCGGAMGGIKMDHSAASPETKGGSTSEPHAGMGEMSGGGMSGGCSCCGGQGGGMCGKQAQIKSDGTNDPLLNDPMWGKQDQKPKIPNQSPKP